jgi:hypothetical protein
MNITNNREERKLQKERLAGIYSDYSPIYHDVFVIRFNQEKERESLKNYMVERGILKTNAVGL